MFEDKETRKNEESQEKASEQDSFGELLEKLAEKGPIFSDNDEDNR